MDKGNWGLHQGYGVCARALIGRPPGRQDPRSCGCSPSARSLRIEHFTAVLGLRPPDSQEVPLCATAVRENDNTSTTPRDHLCTGCLLRTPCIPHHHMSCIAYPKGSLHWSDVLSLDIHIFAEEKLSLMPAPNTFPLLCTVRLCSWALQDKSKSASCSQALRASLRSH